LFCLVTDRHRLCAEAAAPVTPVTFDAARRRLVEQAKWAVKSNIDLIQVRERDLEANALATLVGDLVRVSRGSGTRVVVNDRVDVALACGADGVHLRHDSVPADALRAITPDGFLVGRSVHELAEAEGAGPVDYLIAGTVFSTPSKPATLSTPAAARPAFIASRSSKTPDSAKSRPCPTPFASCWNRSYEIVTATKSRKTM